MKPFLYSRHFIFQNLGEAPKALEQVASAPEAQESPPQNADLHTADSATREKGKKAVAQAMQTVESQKLA